MIDRAGSSPPISLTTAVISGSPVTLDRSCVSKPFGSSMFRGRARSGSTTQASSILLPACRATRSPRSNSSRATPEPMVPKPTMATFTVSMADQLFWQKGEPNPLS